MTNFERLVNAKLDVYTSVWSDDPNAPARDWQKYRDLLESQSEFSDEEIIAVATELYNGTKTRQQVFGN